MKNNLKSIHEVHDQINEWLKSLDFVTDELGVFKNRLSEVSSKNNKLEVRAQIEHFENQFIMRKEQVDEYRHMLKEQQHELTKKAANHPFTTDNHFLRENLETADKINSFTAAVKEMKDEFNEFLGKVL